MKELKFKTQVQKILNTSKFDQSYKRAAERLKVNVSVIILRDMISSLSQWPC